MSMPPPPPPPPSFPGADGPVGQPYGAPKTDSQATVSLVLGILSLICLGFLAGIPAIILGNNAKKRIAASGGQLTGGGMANAGFILGIIGTALSVVGLIVALAS